eukprot:4571598-Pyramimonas_sp.AAC.1
MRLPHPVQRFVAIGSCTEGRSDAVRMRAFRPVQRFVAPWGVPPKALVAQFACVSPTQKSVSWPHREFHGRRYPQM